MIDIARLTDAHDIAEMSVLMWNNHTIEDLEKTFTDVILKDDSVVMICRINNEIIGFAQCGLRYDYVEGTKTSPVGYLEGIFVKESYRGKGYARELLKVCEKWVMEKGCKEFASDCEIDNEASLEFHLKLGFIEKNRIICFNKKL